MGILSDFLLSPVGPEIPVVVIDKSQPVILDKFSVISFDVLRLTAPYFLSVFFQ